MGTPGPTGSPLALTSAQKKVPLERFVYSSSSSRSSPPSDASSPPAESESYSESPLALPPDQVLGHEQVGQLDSPFWEALEQTCTTEAVT